MTRTRTLAAAGASFLVNLCVASLAAPAAAMQILDAVDHAELAAEVSATGVNRIAVAGDRIARIVRSPHAFAAEHDAETGEVYLRPLEGEARDATPVTLFVGTEKGFTYRLTLIPAMRDSAQILIRNPAVASGAGAEEGRGDARVTALVALVRAVARRAPPAGYAVEGRGGGGNEGIIETWRGPRFTAHVVEAGRDVPDAAALAGTFSARAGRVAAAWLADGRADGARPAVVVVETRGAAR